MFKFNCSFISSKISDKCFSWSPVTSLKLGLELIQADILIQNCPEKNLFAYVSYNPA